MIIFSIAIILSKKEIKNTGKKINALIRKYYLKAIYLVILILSTANLIVNAVYSMEIIREESSVVPQNTYASLSNIYDRIINNLKEYDDSIYRIENKFTTTNNDSLTYEYNGISYSSSAYSKTLYNFLEKLGFRRSHVRIVASLENTKTVDMLLGVKYLIVPPTRTIYKDYEVEYEDLFIETNAKIYRNPYSLSLGYGVDDDIFNVNIDNNNTFELQNEILKNMANLDENVYTEHQGEITQTIEDIEQNGTSYVKVGENAKITFEFEAESEENIYMYMLAESSYGISVYINGEETTKYTGYASNEMINIGKRNIGETITIEIILERRH